MQDDCHLQPQNKEQPVGNVITITNTLQLASAFFLKKLLVTESRWLMNQHEEKEAEEDSDAVEAVVAVVEEAVAADAEVSPRRVYMLSCQ